MGAQGTVKGYLCVVTAALLWAFSGIAGKALFQTGVKPAELVQFRVTLACLLLFLALLSFRRSMLRIRLHDIPLFLFLGGCVMAVLQLSYFLAIKSIQVAAAILLQYLAPILVGIFSMIFWKEKCTPPKVAALVLSLAGCYLVVGGYNLELVSMNKTGLFWGLCSALFFATYTLIVEKQMHRFQPWTVLFYCLLFAALSLNTVFTPLAILSEGHSITQWLLILYVAVFGTLIPFGLFSVGVNHIRSTRAIITATLEPISAAVMAFFLISEMLSMLQLAGGLFVIGAIIILQREREHDNLSPEAIRAGQQTRQP